MVSNGLISGTVIFNVIFAVIETGEFAPLGCSDVLDDEGDRLDAGNIIDNGVVILRVNGTFGIVTLLEGRIIVVSNGLRPNTILGGYYSNGSVWFVLQV